MEASSTITLGAFKHKLAEFLNVGTDTFILVVNGSEAKTASFPMSEAASPIHIRSRYAPDEPFALIVPRGPSGDQSTYVVDAINLARVALVAATSRVADLETELRAAGGWICPVCTGANVRGASECVACTVPRA